MSEYTKTQRKRRVTDSLRTASIKQVAKEYQVTEQYVYGAINGSHNSGITSELKKAYERKYNNLKQAIEG
ncbi:MAG: hypothetical protein LC105_05980 [Chitinophagales bacterium]|nr:hypothetical protein [Chitinophagales bacterium]